jgi:two-component system response regulator AtoC
MVTAHGTVRIAVEAMRRGAFDFVVKPPRSDELAAIVHRAIATREGEQDLSDLYFELPTEVVFRDRATLALLDRLRRVAPTELSVLVRGETGVGKEVFARLLHEWSGRADGPLVRINCAAIPETLFESEVFGHEKGAFTGAEVTKPGRAELASGGTLFLDEIGDLGLPAQAKLLEFLEHHTFVRVGGLRTLTADVRVVAATSRDLTAAVDEGRFRRDLYYRLAGLEVEVPPLRERPDDISALTRHFVARYAARLGRDLELGDGLLTALQAHAWPGNVRELEHVLERAVALANGGGVRVEDAFPPGSDASGGSLREQRRAFERRVVAAALRESGGNRTRAAQSLGISRRTLQNKLHELDLG